MNVDLLAIGDTQFDTIMVLAPEEIETLCDVQTHETRLCLDYAGKIPVNQLTQLVAGNAANVAVTGARLGYMTAFWTMLGDDGLGDRELAQLAREGIDLDWARKTSGTQSHQSTVISVSGERTILVYHAPRQYRLPTDLPVPNWMYLTSMGKGSESVFSDLAHLVQSTGAQLAYQPGTFQLRLGAAVSQEILVVTRVILMNKEEAQAYTGEATDDEPTLVRALIALGPSLAVITDAANGAWAGSATELWHIGVRPDIPRLEATGAGDAFSAAFVAALIDGQPVPEALRWGTFNAEAVIQQVGPQAGILTRTQLDEQLTQFVQFQAEEVS